MDAAARPIQSQPLSRRPFCRRGKILRDALREHLRDVLQGKGTSSRQPKPFHRYPYSGREHNLVVCIPAMGGPDWMRIHREDVRSLFNLSQTSIAAP